MTAYTHHTHPEIIKRLNRARGHLQSVTNMIEEDRSCLEIAQQLHAVEKAIQQAKKTLVQDHIDHCMEAAIGPLTALQREHVKDFKAIARYL